MRRAGVQRQFRRRRHASTSSDRRHGTDTAESTSDKAPPPQLSLSERYLGTALATASREEAALFLISLDKWTSRLMLILFGNFCLAAISFAYQV